MMKGSRAVSTTSGPPEGSPEGVDLSLTGLPPPVSRRPNSASAAKPMARSVSMTTGSEPRRKALEATGPGAARAVNNLRRANSTTQVSQPWTGPLRPAEPADFQMLFEGSPGGRETLATLSKVSSEQGATWNILDEQPRASAAPSSALGSPAGLRRRDCAVVLAPSFTANNRSSKRAVGNCVPSMVHNHCGPAERPPPPECSHRTAPLLNNLIKAATDEGNGDSGSKRPQKNLSGSSHTAPNNARGPPVLLRRKEVTEEEAERFILQVNQAAVAIQRWYRCQVQRRQARATRLQRLLASKRQEQRQRLGEGGVLDLCQGKEAERRKVREEKARQARRAAVQELQQKRAQKLGDGEAGLLQETRAPGRTRPAQELSPKPRNAALCTLKANNAGASPHPAGPEDSCQPPPSSSPDASPKPQPSLEDKPQDISSQDMARKDPEVGGLTGSRTKSQVTLSELLDTLKLLEQEPEPLPRPKAYHKEKYAWAAGGDDASSLTADNLEKFGKLSAAAGPPEVGTLLSEAKLQSIMTFLDEMEQSGQGWPPVLSRQEGLREGLARPEPLSEGSACVVQLELELEEKRQAAVLLQRALTQQRDLTARKVKETEKELGRQLRQQREHYEATIQRHLTFIDQLIEDKKSLSERCEAVVAELKQLDGKCRARVAQMQEQHELEMKKLKELMSATEKVRREKWINEKTKKIKEITVKGLEPEIQKLIAKHKQEIKKLKSLHEAELLQSDERAAQHYGRQAEELRGLLEREKEALGRRERELAQQRLEQHLEQEQQMLQQQRRRLYSEVAEEKERLGQQAARQRAELEELRQQLEESSSAASRALQAEFERSREEQECRHQTELKALKDQLEVERQTWGASYAKKEAWLLAREQELKEEIRKGRDKEIELVVHRLEADVALAKEENERSAESRVKRLRDKYEAELSELEQSERRLQERCTELKGRLGEAEGESVRLQGLLRQKEKELQDVRTVNEQLLGERGGLVQVVRQEFADRLAATEEESRQARAELAELRARHRVELQQLVREKQEEMEEVHRRVKMAIAKKEETMSSLRKQHEAAMKRADHLEELLEQCRRQPLAK
ncbi:centrosomal protein of 131 kDa isoform X2 [Tamandua tetradactyla]|uniref:centrosomal protein of 131 kDa isoform X2 n=1 Tax=Tamandua tetradactyla TaxID=48850 RepID=UPI004053E34D